MTRMTQDMSRGTDTLKSITRPSVIQKRRISLGLSQKILRCPKQVFLKFMTTFL